MDESGRVSRRALLAGGLTLGAAAVTGAVVTDQVPGRLRRLFVDAGPDGTIPQVEPGLVHLEQRASAARGRNVGFFVAVPAGYGDGEGLPVCLVLHGASATTADFAGFGLGEFLTDSVQRTQAPFVLVGADGGRQRWQASGDDDPATMVTDELPAWCEEWGFDTRRMAGHGWSMGGYGALRVAADQPGWLRTCAVLSPALAGDEVAELAAGLQGQRTALWCGTGDPLIDANRELAAAIDPDIAAFDRGLHTRGYWNRVMPECFDHIGRALNA